MTDYRYYRTRSFGGGGGPIHPKSFYCFGTEKKLSQCESHNEIVSRSHSDDVGMYCILGKCEAEYLFRSRFISVYKFHMPIRL